MNRVRTFELMDYFFNLIAYVNLQMMELCFPFPWGFVLTWIGIRIKHEEEASQRK